MKKISALVIISLMLVTCGRKKDVYEAELLPTTKVMYRWASREIVAVNSSTVTLPADSDTAQNLRVNDVLLSGVSEKTPYGLLRMVTDIKQNGNTMIVTTKDCPIEYAFRKLHVEVTRTVPLNGITLRGSAPVSGQPLAKGQTAHGKITPPGPGDIVTIPVDYYPFNGDDDPNTPEDQVHVAGSIGGGMTYTFGLDIDWGDIVSWPPDPSVTPKVKVGFEISAAAFAKIHSEGTVTKTFEQEDIWYTAYLEPIVIGQLVFLPQLDIKTKVEGSSTGTFTFTLDESGTFSAGAAYSTDEGGTLTIPDPDFQYKQPDISVMQTANVHVNVGPRLHLKLYGVAGPYATVWAFAKIEADSTKTPCWNVNAGFAGDMGLDISAYTLNLVDWNKDFTIVDKTLLSGSCDLGNLPPDGVTDVTEPTFIPWSKRVEDTAAAFHFADSFTGIAQAVDGRYLLSGDSVGALVKMDKEGTNIWTKQYTVRDAAAPVPLRLPVVLNTLDARIFAAMYSPHIIAKLDAAGNPLQALQFDVAERPAEGFTAGLEDASGNIYLAGTLLDAGNSTDVWLIKIDQDCNVLWSKTWGTPSRRETPAGLATFNSEILLIGNSFNVQQQPSTQGFILRLTPDGDLTWAREVAADGIYGDIYLCGGLRSMDGDIIVGGFTDTSQPKELLLKVKADGSFGWATANASDYLGPVMNSFLQLSDGGYLAGGTQWTAGTDHLWLARFDSIGRVLWGRQLDDGAETANASVCLTGEGGVMTAAYTEKGSEGSSLWIMRVPVKTGDISFSAGSDVSLFSPTWKEKDVKIHIKGASVNTMTDVSVPVSEVTLVAQPVTPVVTTLAP